jgi:hypothetical protein
VLPKAEIVIGIKLLTTFFYTTLDSLSKTTIKRKGETNTNSCPLIMQAEDYLWSGWYSMFCFSLRTEKGNTTAVDSYGEDF